MKIRSFNGSEHIPDECGGFTEVSRELNKVFKQRGIYSEEGFIIIPECLGVQQKFPKQVPFLACEYSHPAPFVTQWLQSYNPIVFCISEFARQNLIRGGYPSERVFTSLLGHDVDFWKPVNIEKLPIFTFLSVNTSNDRSGFDIFPLEFLEFAKDKPVRLIIKDRQNDKFEQWLMSLPGAKEKIIYNGKNLTKEQLRTLASQCHVHTYYNNCTSYGMCPNNMALCGLPSLVTWGSALKEITPDWTQPVKVTTITQPLDTATINDWAAKGLHVFPPTLYPAGTTREALDPSNIQDALNYAYSNYEEMLKINQQHQLFIRENLTWAHTVDRILAVLKNY